MAKDRYTISVDDEIMKEFDKIVQPKTGLKRSTWIEQRIREFLEAEKNKE